MSTGIRSPWQVAWSVWHALFIREVLARIMVDRFGWFWMLFEPLSLVAIMVGMRELMGRIKLTVGAEYIPWLIVGITAFLLFRNALTRSMAAIEANQALFAYRQVKPIDTVLARNAMELVLKCVVLLILIALGALLGMDTLPDDPLGAVVLWLSIWFLGLGGALIFSVAARLVPDIRHVVTMMMMPMMMFSGAIFPIQTMPHPVQEYLLYNPVLHGLELLRLEFFNGYKTMAGVDLGYLWRWNLAMLALGLAMHVRFESRLKAK